MAERKSVTVALTARQKEKIRNATGKSIGALKIQSASGTLKPMLTAKKPLRTFAKKSPMTLGRRTLAKRTFAKRTFQ